MKIPKEVKIGSQIYKVRYFDRDKADINGNLGSTHLVRNEIIISSSDNIALTQQEQTLFHEIIEAINFLYELELSHSNISIIGEAVYQVLKDNNLLKV